ncbi:hypothetical protein ACLOJK_025372 [Asimina triloba]
MSGSGKKVADLAKKAAKGIDWDGMAKLIVSEEARKEFNTLRRTFNDVNHQLQTKFSQARCGFGRRDTAIGVRVLGTLSGIVWIAGFVALIVILGGYF